MPFDLEPPNHLCPLDQEWVIRLKFFDLVEFSPSRMVAQLQDEGSFQTTDQSDFQGYCQGQSDSKRPRGFMWARWVGALDCVWMWEFDKWHGFNFNILEKQENKLLWRPNSFWISFLLLLPNHPNDKASKCETRFTIFKICSYYAVQGGMEYVVLVRSW